MEIEITILESPEGIGAVDRVCFASSGGSIGRNANNDLCLPDPDLVISSAHAQIECDGLTFYFIDLSTNGSYLNDSSEQLAKKEKHPLQSGDRLRLGSYLIQVSVKQTEVELPDDLDVVDFLDSDTNERVPTNTLAAHSTHAKIDGPSERSMDSLGNSSPFAKNSLELDDEVGSTGSGLNFLGETDPLKILGDKYASDESRASAFDKPVTTDNFSAEASSQRIALPDYENTVNQNESLDVSSEQSSSIIPSGASFEDLLSDNDEVQPNIAATRKDDSISVGAPVKILEKKAKASYEGSANLVEPVKAQENVLPKSSKPARSSKKIPKVSSKFASAQLNSKENPKYPTDEALGKKSTKKVNVQKRSVTESKAPESDIVNKGNAGQILAQMLKLNSLDVDQVNELPEDLSNIVLTTINALMQLLRARSELKNEFRLGMTMIAQKENNPLKFSVSAEQALENMYRKDAGTLEACDAIEDTLKDLMEHQVAIIAGLRAAFDGMLNYFEPESLKKHLHFDASFSFEKLLTGTERARYWEAFKLHHENLKADSDNTFKRLFGEEFGRVYELKLTDLKKSRKKNKK